MVAGREYRLILDTGGARSSDAPPGGRRARRRAISADGHCSSWEGEASPLAARILGLGSRGRPPAGFCFAWPEHSADDLDRGSFPCAWGRRSGPVWTSPQSPEAVLDLLMAQVPAA